MTSSRLAYDNHGRLIAIEDDGTRWLVLGNLVCSTVTGDVILFGWLGTSGRPPTPREREEARPPYEIKKRPPSDRPEVPDELLNEQQALEACRREQEREPADLLHQVAA
jgi:hypothetical protein